ncbi:MAG: hypothetical protein V5783_06515 [Pontiella sp.]
MEAMTTLIGFIFWGIVIILLLGRLFGWALGIRDLRMKSETIITQNDNLLKALAKLAEKQSNANREKRDLHNGIKKQCPACAELIKFEATKCRHCHTLQPV